MCRVAALRRGGARLALGGRGGSARAVWPGGREGGREEEEVREFDSRGTVLGFFAILLVDKREVVIWPRERGRSEEGKKEGRAEGG